MGYAFELVRMYGICSQVESRICNTISDPLCGEIHTMTGPLFTTVNRSINVSIGDSLYWQLG